MPASGRVSNLTLRQAVAYRPFYSPAVFPPTSTLGPSLAVLQLDGTGIDEPGIGPPDDFTLASDRDGLRYTAFGQLGRRLSPRSRLEFRGRYGVADFGGADSDIDNDRWLAGVNYTYDVTRELGADFGYNYRSFSTSSGTQVAHDLNLGVVFNKAFVLQRGQTTFSFTPGTTMLVRERVSDDVGGDRLRVRVIGSANVTHRFTTAWQGTLGLRALRGVPRRIHRARRRRPLRREHRRPADARSRCVGGRRVHVGSDRTAGERNFDTHARRRAAAAGPAHAGGAVRPVFLLHVLVQGWRGR